jgi:predicted RNase H-like HicB family nuclease
MNNGQYLGRGYLEKSRTSFFIHDTLILIKNSVEYERKYTMNKYTIIVEKDEDRVLIGSAVELPGCHTQAKTYDELYSRMKEVIELYLEVEKDKVPVVHDRFVGI